jgi:two-component system response regulator YesN
MANDLVRQTRERIERDYASKLTLRAMSATVGMEPARLGRLFRQEVGATIREYLTRVRLEHAVVLVRDGVKIEAIALTVGYRSKKSFYKRFRRCYGTTPLQYRSGEAAGTSAACTTDPATPQPGQITPQL